MHVEQIQPIGDAGHISSNSLWISFGCAVTSVHGHFAVAWGYVSGKKLYLTHFWSNAQRHNLCITGFYE